MKKHALLLLISLVSVASLAQTALNGTLTYLNGSHTPLDGVTVYLRDASNTRVDSALTGQDGSFQFRNVAGGNYSFEVKCSKQWGGVNAADALAALKHFTGLNFLTGLNRKAADVETSGYVNASDALMITRRYVGLLNTFPVGDWAFTADTIHFTGSGSFFSPVFGLCYGDIDGSYAPPPCIPAPTTANAGPDLLNLPGTSVNLAGNVPLSGNGQWTILSGSGGTLSDPGLNSCTFFGVAGNTYQLAWTITTACYSSTDTVMISFASGLIEPCAGISSFVYGGQTYNTVQIGTQCWMKENLNIGTMVTSDYTGSSHSEASDNGIVEKFCYNNDPANCAIYGGLYDWNEMMGYTAVQGVRGICPSGWHIPALEEFCKMTDYLDSTVDCNAWGYSGTDAGGKMKEIGLDHWLSPNTGATNESGFSALGTGSRADYGNFNGLGYYTVFWTSSENAWSSANGRGLLYYEAAVDRGDYYKTGGYSVRCLKDTCLSSTTSDAGPDQLGLPGTSATLAANMPGTGETGTWSIISGSGGNVMDIHSSTSSFTGNSGANYILTWTIANACHTSIDTIALSFVAAMGLPCPGLPSFEYGGQTYHTVQIGSQCWMRENLNIGTRVNGGVEQTNNGLIEKYCYDNLESNCDVYGGLYQWNEMMNYLTEPGSRGICPAGWYVPTDNDWCTMTTFLDPSVNCSLLDWSGTNAGGMLRETGTDHWMAPNDGATNVSNFTALGAGYRSTNWSTFWLKTWAYFWTSSQYDQANGLFWLIGGNRSDIDRNYYLKPYGFSVRCIKDTCAYTPMSYAGPDQLDLAGTVATLAASTPGPGETGTWNIISGTGGTVQDIHSPISSITGAGGTAYTLTWTVANTCTYSVDTVIVSFTSVLGQPCPGLPSFDYGGQTYHTVLIGTQCWMKENLNIGTRVNLATEQTNNALIEKYCYGNLESNCDVYGGLYQWNELMQYSNAPGAAGICPAGWHIPTDTEWCTMATCLDPAVNCSLLDWSGTNAGGKLKETGTDHWLSPNTGATNESNFTARGAGYRSTNWGTYWLNTWVYFWTSSEYNSTNGIYWLFGSSRSDIFRSFYLKPYGFSARCVKDN